MTVSGCAAAPPPDDAGDHATIVSLNPCADAILADIAAPGQLLAVSHYSHDPAASSMPPDQAMRYPSTGGTAEEVLALAPDMVVADAFIAPATRRALEQAGVQVEVLGIAGTLDDSLAQIATLGAATGNADRAAALSHRIAAAWQASEWHGAPVTALLWQEGGLVAGEGSLAQTLLEHSGFASLSAARGLGQGAYLPLEQVLADPPRVLIVAGDDAVLHHPVLARLDGVEQARIAPAMLYCAGPTIPRALARLGEIRAQVPPLPLAGGAGGGPVTHNMPSPQPPPAGGRGRS
ncbi:MAG: ABC transporter substrate-binding protein [Erythrobacter sp.]|nr:ABC transporter substrate-binding protein [Erythrobacter sp.]